MRAGALEPVRVAALEGARLAAVDLDDPVDDPVEEVAVVGDHADGAGKLLERRLERLDRVDVEVVRRLVEHEQVRLGEHQQQQLEPRPLAAGEELVRPPHLLVREEELHQQRDRLALGAAVREPDRVERARLGIERLLVLGEVADPDRRADPDLALGRLQLADDGLQQHALAGAVRADEADALAVHDRQLDVGEHDVVAELHPDVAELEDALAAAHVRVQAERDLAPLEHGPLDLLHACRSAAACCAPA